MTTSDEYDQAIGRAIQNARNLRGWSQATLAQKLSNGDTVNWHQQTILRLEAGQRSLKVRELLRLADVLDVSPVGLLEGSVRSQRGKELDRDDITWMIRDLGQSKGDLEDAQELHRTAMQNTEYALQRIRHHLDVLGADLVQRRKGDFELYESANGGEPDDQA
ncbi:helix-turn-helix domain-containing protein [Prescottella equi]|uniref:helix-turn-helix domain-containing protein n=1 Tax=Rhodococcus hoagii TaxID=43767 RepID=UPI000A0FEA43|nr:helix-turn-helix transcriptional regulator [Prescottella equi]ORM08873.1 hypothetical protein A5N72_02150 [Prescottella equi]